MFPNPTSSCWYLTGPTASGKTAVGLELAARLGAEIISLDSMAVYRGMDIGTAKPSPFDRGQVPHHLIDVVEPHQVYSLARYVDDAQRAVDEIAARDRVPLFVGGTPLYLKALLRGIFSGPQANWPRRRELLSMAQLEGPEAVHERLKQIDPLSAARLQPRDTRRVIRAIEVWEQTGQSISALQQQFDRARGARQCRVFVLDWPRAVLTQRIDERVEAMFAQGLVAEVAGLVERYSRLSHTAGQAIGYREVIEHLQGARNLIDTMTLVKLRSRQLAKRQMTWFRSLSECRLVPRAVGDDHRLVASQIAGAEIEMCSYTDDTSFQT